MQWRFSGFPPPPPFPATLQFVQPALYSRDISRDEMSSKQFQELRKMLNLFLSHAGSRDTTKNDSH